jgi:hypothetical protein
MERYQVYDGTTFKYLEKVPTGITWTCFKTRAHCYETREDAEAIIKFFKPFTANALRVLIVKKKQAPLKPSVGFAQDSQTV